MATYQIQQLEIPPDLLGPLVEYQGELSDQQALQETISEHGYLVLRAGLDRSAVLAAREEVMMRLQEVGEICAPAIDGIATGSSQRSDGWRLGRVLGVGEPGNGVTSGYAWQPT